MIENRYEIWKVRSKRFKRWVSNEFWKGEGKVPNSDAFNSALNIIEAKACFEGKQHELHTRVAWYENAIWYDLGDWRAVKVTKSEWKIIDDPPILFRHYPHQKVQVMPECHSKGEKGITDLFRFMNLSKDYHALYTANMICAFIPDIPHPIDTFSGDQGTAKTTHSRIKKELLDPSELKTFTYPNTKAEFAQMANHHYFFFLDNMTSLPEWLSDSLCRVVTGDGFSKRELYTDDEDIFYSFKRCVGINGINLVPSKPDLLDRTLIYELDPIERERRKEEKVFWAEFNKAKPKILGALFSLLSKAMDEYKNVKLKGKPRMADFATWGCAVARALGIKEFEFMEKYSNNIVTQNKEALEASPVAQAIMAFMGNKDDVNRRNKWEGSPSKLLEELDVIAEKIKLNTKDKQYPKDARWLWRRIKAVRTNLQAVGIVADKDDTDHTKGRRIVLKSVPQKDSKNDVRDDMMSEGEQSQGVTTDNITDDTDNTTIDGENDVRRKSPKSLETDNTDDTDIISEGFKDGDVENETPEEDLWDKREETSE